MADHIITGQVFPSYRFSSDEVRNFKVNEAQLLSYIEEQNET